jgi:uncharacterized coiled-coil protein SlyX
MPALPAEASPANGVRKTVTMREREGLIERIRKVRRLATAADTSARQSTVAPKDDRLQELETRIAHLEQLVEGLQNSVHRESARHAKLIAELQAQIQPGAMGSALAEDARSRGL